MWNWKQLKWAKMLGWWPYDMKDENQRTLYEIGGLVTFCILPLDIGLQATCLILAIKKGLLKTFLSIIPMIAISASMTLRGAMLFYRSDEINSIIEQFDKLASRWKIGQSSSESCAIMESHMRLCLRLLYCVFIFTGLLILHWAVRPITYAFFGEYTFFVDDWVPWDDQNFLGWLGHIAFTFVVAIIASLAMIIYETLSYAFYEITIANLKIMSNMFKRADFKRRESTYNLYLMHRDLFKVIKDIGELQSMLLQLDCLLSTLILCCGVLEITFAWSPLTKRINLFELCCLSVSLIFWHCYKCETISSMCSEMTYKVYDNNWHEGTRHNKRIVSILNQRSQKPITFGGIININLSTFLSMMKTSFSYYNALKAFDLH